MLAALLPTIVQSILSLLWPAAPAWAGEVIAGLLPLLAELVSEQAGEDTTGAEKMRAVVAEARAAADLAFDDLPGWKDYPEKRRDRIIAGLAELALFLHQVSAQTGGQKAVRKLGRKLRRKQ